MDQKKYRNDLDFENDIRKQIDNIVNDIYSNVINLVKIESESSIDKNHMVSMGVSASLPGILTSVSLLMGWPVGITVGLAFLGGIGGAVSQIPGLKNKNDDFSKIKPDESSIKESENETDNKTAMLMSCISSYLKEKQKEIHILENKVANAELIKNDVCHVPQVQETKPVDPDGYDITIDTKFGEWAQRFLMLANKSEDRAIARLGDELVTRLATMKIKVYDEPILNSEGKPDVPFFDYLIDESNGEEYTEVVKPVIYSDRSLLARGEIR